MWKAKVLYALDSSFLVMKTLNCSWYKRYHNRKLTIYVILRNIISEVKNVLIDNTTEK